MFELHLTLLLLQDLQSNVYTPYPDTAGRRAAAELVYFGYSKAQPCSSKAADELSAPKAAFGHLPHGPGYIQLYFPGSPLLLTY